MKRIMGVVAGLVLGAGVVLLAFDDGSGPVTAGPPVVDVVTASASTDTSAAEQAACDAYRRYGPAATIADWVAVSHVLDGTRLGRGAAAVRAAAEGGSRVATYGAVLDVLESCLAVGA